MSEGMQGANIGSGTVAGLLGYFDWVIDKKHATPSAMTPLKSAAKQVFQTVEGNDPIDDIDVRSLDRDGYFGRFEVAMRTTGRLSPDSIRAYRNRFNRALSYYDEYLANGSTPKLATRGSAAIRGRRDKPAPLIKMPGGGAPAIDPDPSEPVSSNMISYPFPLESGEIANLRLPKQLSKRDAARLAAFLNALIFEPQRQLGTGSEAEETPI